MKLSDLFEEVEAHTIQQLVHLAITHHRVKFHGRLWGVPLVDGVARHVTWTPLSGPPGTRPAVPKDYISFYVHDSKPYYAWANFNNKVQTTVLDPEIYIDIETRLGRKYSKDDFIEALLRIYKGESEDDAKSMIGDLIKASRQLGHDYPEFRAIEKSLGK